MIKNSLRTQLIFRTFIIIGGVLVIYLVMSFVQGKSQRLDVLTENNKYHAKNFNHAINSRLTDLELTTQLLSTLVFSNEYSGEVSPEKVIKKINDSWPSINKGSHFLQMLYYDSAHNYLRSWGVWSNDTQLLLNDEPEVNLDPFIKKEDISDFIQGLSFFSCADICYLNYAKVLSPYGQNSDAGYLIIRYPVVAILDELDELLPLVTAVAYEDSSATSDFLYYKNEKNIISDISGVASQDTIITKTLGDKITADTGESKVDGKVINYSIFDLDTAIENVANLKVLFFSDVTASSNDLYTKNLHAFLFSVFTLFLTTFLILILLRKPMNSLGEIASVMPIIGDGQFSQANARLKKISKDISSDEISTINEITIKLTENLEKAHAEIMTSLEYKSERYDFIQQLIDTSPAVFITYDNNQNILLCNKYTEILLGIPREEVTGLNYIKLFNFDDETTENDDDAWSFNTFISDSDGNKRMFSWMRTVFTSQINNQSQTICVGIDTTYRLKLEDDIRFIAEHDSLTGLLNRRKIDELINQYIEEVRPFYLLYIDVNYFKLVNDMLGHQAGDELLIDIAKMLERIVGDLGIVGRTGGDEFTVVLFTNDRHTTELLCQELITSSNSIGTALGNDRALPAHVSLSIGLVAFPENATTLEALYSKADAAMYENKIHRNGDFHFFTGNETLIEEIKTQKHWEDLIKESIKNKNILPYFQGIHDSKDTSSICFYEVLCRVEHDGKVLPASHFIDEISNLPLLRELDELILRSATQVGSQLDDKPVFMVNFSGLTISSLSNERSLNNFLASIDYPLDKIVIEITEQSAIKDLDKTVLLMNTFKKRGIRFALDDFGTGYSSLSYLRRMPFDFLKIDKSFMTESIKDSQNLNFVKSIIELVQGLNLKVIIEGVENLDILKLTDDLEAEFLQGYHLSEPQAEISAPLLNRS